jgi:single-stranded-DNA-specific exonuclease
VAGTWTIDPFDAAAAGALEAELGLSPVTAAVLARRGYTEVEAARRFLDAELPGHDPLLLGDMAVAVERIQAAVADGRRICVHGDYDVDGISATAVAVLVLRELGATVEWGLPSRFEEGYGLARGTI